MAKLSCTQDQLLALAKKHSVTKCRTPLPISTLLQLGVGGRAVLPEKTRVDSDYHTYFCQLSYEVNPMENEAFHLCCWNWPEQVLHSTLIVYHDNHYKIETHTELGERYASVLWKHFIDCAKKGKFFIMPRRVKL